MDSTATYAKTFRKIMFTIHLGLITGIDDHKLRIKINRTLAIILIIKFIIMHYFLISSSNQNNHSKDILVRKEITRIDINIYQISFNYYKYF